jgi:branched-subunit amino acid transport protein
MKQENLLLILGMAVVTFIPRFIPMAFLSRRAIPENIKAGLEYIPVGILSAIVFPLIFFDGPGAFAVQPRLLLSAIPVSVFGWKVRSLWGSVMLGMVVYWGLGFVF